MAGEVDLDDALCPCPQVVLEGFEGERAPLLRLDDYHLFALNEIAHHLVELTDWLSMPGCLNGELLGR